MNEDIIIKGMESQLAKSVKFREGEMLFISDALFELVKAMLWGVIKDFFDQPLADSTYEECKVEYKTLKGFVEEMGLNWDLILKEINEDFNVERVKYIVSGDYKKAEEMLK